MRATQKCAIALGGSVLVFVAGIQTGRYTVSAQKPKSAVVTRVFTGPDNKSHFEAVEIPFSAVGGRDVGRLMSVTGAELHRASAGRVADWHPGPQRQYVVTISGRGEVEVAGGQRKTFGPGSIELIEDVTGQGHISRVVGSEDRITLWLPIADQPKK